jgi:hypothetical protein
MILKSAGNFCIHRLCVIHIYEADYNLLLSVKYRALIRAAQAKHIIHRGQHGGIPGHDATNLVLLEQLINDICYSFRKSSAAFDNDAASEKLSSV